MQLCGTNSFKSDDPNNYRKSGNHHAEQYYSVRPVLLIKQRKNRWNMRSFSVLAKEKDPLLFFLSIPSLILSIFLATQYARFVRIFSDWLPFVSQRFGTFDQRNENLGRAQLTGHFCCRAVCNHQPNNIPKALC